MMIHSYEVFWIFPAENVVFANRWNCQCCTPVVSEWVSRRGCRLGKRGRTPVVKQSQHKGSRDSLLAIGRAEVRTGTNRYFKRRRPEIELVKSASQHGLWRTSHIYLGPLSHLSGDRWLNVETHFYVSLLFNPIAINFVINIHVRDKCEKVDSSRKLFW